MKSLLTARNKHAKLPGEITGRAVSAGSSAAHLQLMWAHLMSPGKVVWAEDAEQAVGIVRKCGTDICFVFCRQCLLTA